MAWLICLPMRDDFVLGHALRQHLRTDQRDPWDKLTALDAPRGQVLLDHQHWNLALLDEIDDIIVHAWRLGLLPPTDGEPWRTLPGNRVVHGVAAQHRSVLRPRALHRGKQPKDRVVLLFHDGPIGRLNDVQGFLSHGIPSLRRNGEYIVRRFAERMEIGWRAPPAGDEIAHTAFVNTHAAVHPVDLAAVFLGKR